MLIIGVMNHRMTLTRMLFGLQQFIPPTFNVMVPVDVTSAPGIATASSPAAVSTTTSVRPTPPRYFRIYLSLIGAHGGPLPCDVQGATKVSEIRAQVEAELGMDSNSVDLSFRGIACPDHVTMDCLEVLPQSIMTVIFRHVQREVGHRSGNTSNGFSAAMGNGANAFGQ